MFLLCNVLEQVQAGKQLASLPPNTAPPACGFVQNTLPQLPSPYAAVAFSSPAPFSSFEPVRLCCVV